MLTRGGAWAARHPRLVLLTALILSVLAGVVGAGAADRLSTGGFTDDAAPSARAARYLEDSGRPPPNLLLLVTTWEPASSAAATAAGSRLTERLGAEAGVTQVASYWSLGRPDELAGDDGRSALVVGRITGDERTTRRVLDRIIPAYTSEDGPVQVRVGGRAAVARAISQTSEADLRRAELIALPATLVLLLLVFGGAVAAVVPLCVAVVAVLGTMAALRGLTELTDVSVFALNLTTGLGLGLAVDYSLFIVSRYREELGRGLAVPAAIVAAMATAGRTVAFSAVTLALCLSALLVFPLGFLRSTAYAGILVVGLALLGALTVLPALLAVVGRRIDALDPLAAVRRRRRARPHGTGWWHGLARRVLRRRALAATGVTAVLLLLAGPFLHADFANSDDRTLPERNAVRQVHDALRSGFAHQVAAPVDVVLPAVDAGTRAGLETADLYARALSVVPGAGQVNGPTGAYRDGERVRPASGQPAGAATGPATLTLLPDVDPASPDAERLVRAVRADLPPGAMVGGPTAEQLDAGRALDRWTPTALAVVGGFAAVVVLIFSGGVVLALKAVVVNLLSLSASFGAMVWVFQDGHLRWLVGDVTVTGTLDATTPILMFCVAFGLSMDYEILLLGRIGEAYRSNGADCDAAVCTGLQASAGLMTASAGVVAVVFVALIASEVAFLKLLGLGLALAVLLDATVVRGVLVPACIGLAGRANWWAPDVVHRMHRRVEAAPAEAWPPGPGTAPAGPQPTRPICLTALPLPAPWPPGQVVSVPLRAVDVDRRDDVEDAEKGWYRR